MAASCDSVALRRTGLLTRGPRCEVAAALAAFPNARRVVLDFGGGRHAGPGALLPSYRGLDLDLDLDMADVDHILSGADPRTSPVPPARDTPCTNINNHSTSRTSTSAPQPCPSDVDLLCAALAALRGRGITSLALLHLACPPPPPSALAHLRPTLIELELSDSSYARATDQGAFNLLVRERGDICARSDALVRLAVSLPQLRCLSISSAAFSVDSVAALGCLTRLEALSVVGCVECPGAAPQAAETYRSLLRVLRQLRQLRLPMAVASPSMALLDDDDDDDHNGEDDNDVFGGVEGGRGGGSGGANFFGGLYSGQHNLGTEGWRSSMHATLAGGWPITPAPNDPRVANPSPFRPGPAVPCHTGAASLIVAGTVGLPAAAETDPRIACSDKHAAAAFGDLIQPAAQCRRQHPSQLSFGFVFPPNLQDLTIPLCSLNRPVFEAVCAAYAAPPSGGGGATQSLTTHQHPEHGCARCLAHCTGISVPWRRHHGEDSGANAAAAEPSLPAGAAVPCSLSCCASGAALPMACGGAAAAATAAHRSAGGCAGGGLRSLHIPTLAGYSHWEGSFLASARDFQMLARLTSLEQLHLSLDVGAFRMSREGMRACFQNLLALRSLMELRISEAQQPTCFSVRKRSSGCHPHPTRGFGAVTTTELSGPALQQLQRQWPELRTLQFFSETIVRGGGGGGLVVPNGIDNVDLLPPPCACCTAPYLLPAPLRSGGRWGRREPSWLA